MDNMSWLTRKISNKHHDNMHSLSYVFSSRRFQCERKKERKKQDLESFVEVFILFIIIESVKILR
jgi:hypothetical protein